MTTDALTQTRDTQTTTPTTRDVNRYLVPPVDIYETQEALVVVADLPGVRKDGIDVSVEDGMLTIRGRAEHNMPGEEVAGEFRLTDYHRQFRLGDILDPERIQAELKHGVLTLQLPKAEAAKPRKIEVKSV